MTVSIQFEHKGQALLTEMNGDYVTLRCQFSAPPGASLCGTIASENVSVCVKVRDCRQCSQEIHCFIVHGRWVNLSRAARLALRSSVPQGSAK